MVIMAKQAVLFVRPDGQNFYVPNGFIGQAPEWVTQTRQFKEMVADGMIVAAETSSDKDMDAAEKKSSKRSKKAPAEEAEHQDGTAPEQ